jgi:hypothetical protein|nr:MAG TPA: hypothetical protein [Caudoviricetes sp.]
MKDLPKCDHPGSCGARDRGRCLILTCTKFGRYGNEKCPFQQADPDKFSWNRISKKILHLK